MKTRLQILENAVYRGDTSKLIDMLNEYKQQDMDADSWLKVPIEKEFFELVREMEASYNIEPYDGTDFEPSVEEIKRYFSEWLWRKFQ